MVVDCRKRAWRVRLLEFSDTRVGFVKSYKLQGGLYAWKVIDECYVVSHKYSSPAPDDWIGLGKNQVGCTGGKIAHLISVPHPCTE